MFANTDYKLVDVAKKILKKLILKDLKIYKEILKSSLKTIYKIKISSNEAVLVGKKLLPYMVEKKGQMKQLIYLQDIKKVNNFQKRSKKTLALMEKAYQKCKDLKRDAVLVDLDFTTKNRISKFGALWLAGLVDTEGSIYLFKHHIDRYVSCLVITNTSYRIISEARYIIESRLGKSIKLIIEKRPEHQDVYRIRLLGENAKEICRYILPHMISKNKQAKLILDIQNLKIKKRPYSTKVSNRMGTLYASSRYLNHRGPQLLV
ncbi:MAG TPA: LAGLIDADG family homing endonuclease [Candidatus Acidoferrum sp.]|nr:LAGLIDADG family homing endonuclease [Candidatus Acidoferrum sp.]